MTIKNELPRIAMFHGGGSNPWIFKAHCEAVEKQLATQFNFVYFAGPFQSDAGKGVLPFFVSEKWGSYTKWFLMQEDKSEILDGTAGNHDDEEGIERVVRLMRENGPGGKWVGCLGFSQGTRVVAGLLKWQQLRSDKNIDLEGNIDIKFGVLVMGSGPPMESTVPEMLLEADQEISSQVIAKQNELIRIPSLHLHGLKDILYDQGKIQMKSHFDQDTITCIDIDYHHAMPWNKNDVTLLVENVKKLFNM